MKQFKFCSKHSPKKFKGWNKNSINKDLLGISYTVYYEYPLGIRNKNQFKNR